MIDLALWREIPVFGGVSLRSNLPRHLDASLDRDVILHGASAPSPRVRGEGRGEGASPQAQTRGKAPSPGASRRPLPARGERCSYPTQRHVISTAGALARAVLAALILAMVAQPAGAEDSVKVALGQRGNWETAASELGQNASLFRKRGLELELLYTNGSAETLQAVISGSVDIGIGLGTTAVMAAYAKGAPLRVIGNASSGSSEYWYVPADSPVKTMADAGGKTIAYSTTGSSSHLIVLSFIRANGLFAKAAGTGGPAATFTQVMSGQIDVGWSSPPFGLDAVSEGKIRVIAKGNDLPEFRDQTIRLIVANAGFLERRKDVAARYVQGYRDALDWMYSDPAGLDAYAEFAKTSPANAREVRDVYYPRDHLMVDFIAGLDAAMADGIAFRYIAKPLTKEQLGDLFQIPPPIK
jgi:NitT/TauT family transport system substrate-binding protein